MIFPCSRCGCMPPGPTPTDIGTRSAICPCPPDQLNRWWSANTPQLRQARDELRRRVRTELGRAA